MQIAMRGPPKEKPREGGGAFKKRRTNGGGAADTTDTEDTTDRFHGFIPIVEGKDDDEVKVIQEALKRVRCHNLGGRMVEYSTHGANASLIHMWLVKGVKKFDAATVSMYLFLKPIAN